MADPTPSSTPSPAGRSARKIGLLTSLYFSQGLPYGFFNEALPALLRLRGMERPEIGLTNLLSLPWALKFLWAPLVDRFGFRGVGRRRSWILPLQSLAVITLVLVGDLDLGTQLALVLAAMLVLNLLAATQDIATDGLAVAMLDDRERGWGNGVQVAAYRVGMIVGGGVLLLLIGGFGWQGSFLIMAGLLVLATLPILVYREGRGGLGTERWSGEGAVRAPEPMELGWRDFVAFFHRPGVVPWLILLVLFKGGDAIATGMGKPFLVDLGMTITEIGSLNTYGTLPAGLLGALIGGWGVGRFGRRKALIGFGFFQGLAVAAYALPAMGLYTPATLYTIAIVDYAAGGMATAVLFTMMMDVCRPGTEGSDYTLQASITMAAPILARSLSGIVAEPLGYTATFLLSSGLSLAGVGMAALLLADERFRERLLAASGMRW